MRTILILSALLTASFAPTALAECEESATATPDALPASVSLTSRSCGTHHEGGFGDWWYESFVGSDRVEVAATTDATGTSTVWADKWNETILYGTADGSGEQYGDWVEAGHSTSFDGGWRYQRVKLGTTGWEWTGESGWTDSNGLFLESQVYDSSAYMYTSGVGLQRFDAEHDAYSVHSCGLVLYSTALPGWLAALLAETPDPPYEACALL